MTTAVALEVLKIYEEIDIVGHSRTVGRRMLEGLRPLADHPVVGDVNGVGLIAGIELVQDKPTRRSYEPAGHAGRVIDRVGRDNGLIPRVIGDRLGFAPPLVITEEEVDDMLARLSRTLDQAHAELTAG